ncbi:hypothetical protein ACFC0C_16460 [Streptomyces sp. NPDC056178]|uniref:hypothetical protein n=1 Tax=unclassified Streptomyces TaxID=2593676 RepID=UPI0035D76C98
MGNDGAASTAALGNDAAALRAGLLSAANRSYERQTVDILTAQDLGRRALSLLLHFSEQAASARPEGRHALVHLGRIAETAQIVSAELTSALARTAENQRKAALRGAKPIFVGPSPAQRVAAAADLLASVPFECAEGARWSDAAEHLQAVRERAASTISPTPTAVPPSLSATRSR